MPRERGVVNDACEQCVCVDKSMRNSNNIYDKQNAAFGLTVRLNVV